jgi:hypothetical protein
MQLRDILSKISHNKSNGQLNVCIRKNKLKEYGISQDDFLNIKLDSKLNKLLNE